MVRKARLLLALGVLLALSSGAQAATRSILYVANSQGDDITIIDLASQKIIKTLKVGPIVHGVCAQGDGRKAFATIESAHSLKVIDTRSNEVTDTIALDGQPNECAATADGRYVVVPLLAPANRAAIVDVAQEKGVETVPLRGLLHAGRGQQQHRLLRGARRLSHQPHRPHQDGIYQYGEGGRRSPALRDHG